MFDALLIRLRDELDAVSKILKLNDHVIGEFYSIKSPDPWPTLRVSDPGKHRWEIYNQCAALTRLYAVYSAFIEDLIKEYLLILPELYDTYGELPEAIVTQHRLGLGQILQKLGNEGPYTDLNEAEVVMQVSRGLAGERPYALVPQAFLVDRQNYRLDPLGRVLGYLGFKNGAERLSQHPRVKSCIDEKWPESTTLRAELKKFVELRNFAAHSELENTIALEELLSISDLLWCVCGAAADILTVEVFQRQLSLKRLLTVGEVFQTYHQGTVAIVKMKPCKVAVDEEVVMLIGNQVKGSARIRSIQDNGKELQYVEPYLDQPIGLRFELRCREGMSIAQVMRAPSEPQQLDLSFGAAQTAEEPEESETVNAESGEPEE